MHADVLRAIAGIEVFPVFSLVLFVTFFSIVLVRTSRLDRKRLASFAAIPLDGTSTETETSHDAETR